MCRVLFCRTREHMCVDVHTLADDAIGRRGRVPLSTQHTGQNSAAHMPPEAGLRHKTTNCPGFKMRFFLRNKHNGFPPVAGFASGVNVFLSVPSNCTSP